MAGLLGHPRPSVIGRSAQPPRSLGSMREFSVSEVAVVPDHQVKLWRCLWGSAIHETAPAWVARCGWRCIGVWSRGCRPGPSGRPGRSRRSPPPRRRADSPAVRSVVAVPGSAAGEREREGPVREDGVGAEEARPGEENIRDQNMLDSKDGCSFSAHQSKAWTIRARVPPRASLRNRRRMTRR